MARFYEIAAWLLTSLSVALLVSSLWLVPDQATFAQTSSNCPGQDMCLDGNDPCRVNSQASACLGKCYTAGPFCKDCRCIPTVLDPNGAIIDCGCRP